MNLKTTHNAALALAAGLAGVVLFLAGFLAGGGGRIYQLEGTGLIYRIDTRTGQSWTAQFASDDKCRWIPIEEPEN